MKKILLLLFCFSIFLSQPLIAEDGKSSLGTKWREYFGMGDDEEKEEEIFEEEEIEEEYEIPPAPKPKAKSHKKSSSSNATSNSEGMMDLIDSPTANVLEYGSFRLNFRLYSEGGVQNHISFGVFRRLNIGATWDVEKLVGSEEAQTVTPTLFVKFRLLHEGDVLPAFSIGFNGQGRFFNRTTDEYNERERGLYGAFTKEIFFPQFYANAGANISKFKEGEVYGFFGLSYTIEEKVALFTEYDNIRVGPLNRWNAGIRFFPTSGLAIDFAYRRIGSKFDKERVIRINWVGSF